MNQPDTSYMALVRHYEACFEKYGATPQGVDWPNAEDLATRFNVMLDILPHPGASAADPIRLLDLGCGPGLLLDHIRASGHSARIAYTGIDLSAPMIESARTRHPGHQFELRNVLVNPIAPQSVDYVVMNGVLTEKRDLTFETMEEFATSLIEAAFLSARKGIAFNAMSPYVDWERDDLFHWPIDRMMAAIRKLSPHITVRADYGLREYTVYLYRNAQRGTPGTGPG